MQEILRQAIRAYLLPESVDPKDPIFSGFPIVRKTGRIDRGSEEIDAILYGGGE